VKEISAAVAGEAGIDEEHVTVTWDYLQPGHYAHAGATAAEQPEHSHPLLIAILAPDQHPADRVERMLRAAAASTADATGVDPANVFVESRAARSGEVFDGGDIVRW
jgi:hypothetical protein